MRSDIKIRIDRILQNLDKDLRKNSSSILKEAVSIKRLSEINEYRYGEVLYLMSLCTQNTGKIEKAIILNEESLELLKDLPDDSRYGEALSNYGNQMTNIGNYEKALEFLKMALRIQVRNKLNSRLIYTYIRIGNVYRNFLRGADKSILYNKKALKLSEKLENKDLVAACLGSIGNSYLYKHNYLISRKYYLKALKLFLETENYFHACNCILGLGTACRLLNKIDESVTFLNKALTILKEHPNKNLETSLSLNLAISYLLKNDKVNYKKYYDRSVSMIKAVGDNVLSSKLYEGFSETFAKIKDYENAYTHHLKFHKLYSEIFREEAERVNKLLRLKYEKEKSEREAELYRLKTDELKREVELKTKELNAMAIYLSQKNEFVKILVENVKSDLGELKIEDSISKYIGNAVRKAESASNINNDLKKFESELEKFSYGFIEKLSKKFHSLTRVELKICAMIKINLSTKEIANLLYLSTRTVESHRYNIYKKIKLKQKQHIVNFLNSL